MAHVLLIGGTGYLGSLLAAELISHTNDRVTLAARGGHNRKSVVQSVARQIGVAPTDYRLGRLDVAVLPSAGDQKSFGNLFGKYQVEEVINCAGAVNYFNIRDLEESCVVLVKDLLTTAKARGVHRFLHVSTAFSSGYADVEVPEAPLDEPSSDPTLYTRYKRASERLIATSGVPYVILRPCIVIGDSRDGRYSGQPYGLYQFWWSYERFLTERYRETLHVIAPDQPLQLLHQDALTSSVSAIRQRVPAGSFVNLVSSPDSLPSVRELFRLWCENVARPQRLFLHQKPSTVPYGELDFRFRTWLDFVSTNGAISQHAWRFERRWLDILVGNGLHFQNATISTAKVCQDWFVSQSNGLDQYFSRFADRFPESTKTEVVVAP